MRFGTSWRPSVLVALALLVSGQFCMLTTCLPRLARANDAAHACCRASGRAESPAPVPTASHTMPCGQHLVTSDAPSVPDAPETSLVLATVLESPRVLASPVTGVVYARADGGPPSDRGRTAPAGLRAPPAA
ncbi:MAG: hypothetical protein RL721_2085 [Candidatus Eisenbacteria bacterium]|jgi:hypothetical protein